MARRAARRSGQPRCPGAEGAGARERARAGVHQPHQRGPRARALPPSDKPQAPRRPPSRTTSTRSPGRSSRTRIVGEIATDSWRTPCHATGRFPVSQIGSAHKRHPITIAEHDVPDGHAILDLPRFREIKPDISLELGIESVRLTFDLLVELDLTGRASSALDAR
jgi:hypothetical protein